MLIEKLEQSPCTVREFKCDVCIGEGKDPVPQKWLASCNICEKHLCYEHRTSYCDLTCAMMDAIYSDHNESWTYICQGCSKLFKNSFEKQLKEKIQEVIKYHARLKLTWKYLLEQSK